METRDGDPVSSQQARQTLQQLASDQDVVRYPPLPRWFFSVMALIVALLFLTELLPGSADQNAKIGLAVCAIVLGARYWLYRDGVAWVDVSVSDMALFLVAVLGTFAACWAISASTDAEWIWIIGAATAGGVVLGTGRRYRQEFGVAR